MPLHLLGKKSWNVYNQDNIDRVRRDEAEARAKEQQAERRTRDDDAAERLRLLRGGSPHVEDSAHHDHKRKRTEEDTLESPQREEKRARRSRTSDEPTEASRTRSRESQEANVTKEPLDKISNMRFRDAAGRRPDAQRPWYSATARDHENSDPGRDVWGNEDAGRHVRNQKRLDASDPLLAIKKGVKQLKDVEKQKSEWRKEREKDLYEVEELAKRERHRRRREERHNHRSERHRSHKSSHNRQKDRDRDRSEHRRSE